MNEIITNIKFWKAIRNCASALTIFLLLLSIYEIRQIFTSVPEVAATNTITVSGSGDVLAKPDIATFSFGVTETAKVVGDAQTAADTKANAAIKAMTDAGVASADIQTLSYNINPHYEYTNASIVCGPNSICPPSNPVVTGYDVSETVQVKVRDLSKAGSLLATVGSLAVQNVDSLQFSIDKPDALQDEARAKAITDAKTKTVELAKELGVRIVRVVSFSDGGVSNPGPIMYAAKAMSISNTATVAPDISTGQQKITSDVSITYEIK